MRRRHLVQKCLIDVGHFDSSVIHMIRAGKIITYISIDE